MNVDATLSAACRAQVRLVQSMRSANVRAESIVFNRDALSAYARNRPPLWTPSLLIFRKRIYVSASSTNWGAGSGVARCQPTPPASTKLIVLPNASLS